MLRTTCLLVLLLAPILVSQFSGFVARWPSYVARLQALIADPGHEWLTKIIGERLPDASKSVSELISQGAGWLGTFIKSLWSGGQALISMFSLIVVTPVAVDFLKVPALLIGAELAPLP